MKENLESWDEQISEILGLYYGDEFPEDFNKVKNVLDLDIKPELKHLYHHFLNWQDSTSTLVFTMPGPNSVEVQILLDEDMFRV